MRRLKSTLNALTERLSSLEDQVKERDEKIVELTGRIQKMEEEQKRQEEGMTAMEQIISDMQTPFQNKEELAAWSVKCREDLKEMTKEFQVLGAQQEKVATSFAEAVKGNKIVKEAIKEVTLQNIETKDFRNTVIGKVKDEVIEQASPLIRATYDRHRSVIISGVKESSKQTRNDRLKDDEEKVVAVLEKIGAAGRNDIQCMYRLGKFIESKARMIKITFESESVQRRVMSLTSCLKECEEYKGVFIRLDRTKDELDKIKAHVEEAKKKNNERTEEEKVDFYWKVAGLKGIKKIYLQRREES